jgi:hypothetical protein
VRGFLWFLLVVFVIVGGATLALRQGWIRIPPNYLPWGPVALDEPPTFLAKWQIGELDRDPEACFDALDRSSIQYRRLPDRPLRNGCGVAARTNIVKSHVAYSSGFESPCALTAALYWYEEALNAIAERELGTQVARIDHFGSYACRNIYGRAEDRRSAHAQARAIDVAGFRLANGMTVSVLRDWGKDTPEGRFLKAAHDESCRFFGIVLSPAYNKAHANHLHLELGRFRFCR